MRPLLLGTKNLDKLAELRRLMGRGVQVLSLDDFPPCEDVEETGKTFLANAKLKARNYGAHTGALTLADDSGLMVDALNGRPGVYSARFAGAGCSYADNNRKLLRLLAGKKRTAKFVCVMALYDGKKFVGAVRGECRGTIAASARGRKGFGYDPVFIPSGMNRTFAQLRPSEKAKVSHRGKALRAAKKLILSYLKCAR